jgi:hypothetical protein
VIVVSFVLAVYLSTVPGAVESMNFIKEDIKPVIKFAINWGMKVALATTSNHAFVVICKRFLQ